MKLYELTDEMNTVSESLESALSWQPDTDADGNPIDDDGNIIDDVDQYRAMLLEAWRNTLEGISGEFDEKAESIAVYIKNLKSDCEQIKREENMLKSRRAVKENALKRITEYLLDEMKRAGKTKIDAPQAVVSIRNNAESVLIDNEAAFIEWAQKNANNLLKYLPPEIRKNDVKSALKAGENIPEARLTRTQSLIVK